MVLLPAGRPHDPEHVRWPRTCTFRIWGLWFRGLGVEGLEVSGLGYRGSRVEGLKFRV